MRASRPVCALACLLFLAAAVGGCGGSSASSSGGGGGGGSTGGTKSRPAPPASAFPSAQGKTLREILDNPDYQPTSLIIEPQAMVFYEGENRYPFGVLEKGGTQVGDAEIGLYFSRVPTPKPGAKSKSGNRGQQAKAERQALDEPAVGPFPAKVESLGTRPSFRSRTTTEDPTAATVVYSSQIDFPADGEWRIGALIKIGDEISATPLPSVTVGEFTRVPRPGQQAPKIHTPTAKEVGGDLSKITTRIPPDTQNRVDYAEALGKEPILLLFATPQFCQSRVCGPVVDVAEEAQERYGDKAAFIHMEIFNDNEPKDHVRPQVRAFHLPSEPWLFAINRHGVVSSAIEGAFGKELMDQTVKKVISE